MRHDAQPEHRREGKESAEAENLAEHAQGTFAVVVDACQYGLCHAAHHSRNELMPRAVPFVRLIVVAHGLRIEILSQYHREQVVVQLVGDVRYQEFATEGKKRLQRTEVDAERRSPRREIPRAERHRNQVSKALCGDAPIGEAAKGERDAQAARNHVGNDTRKGLLAHLQVAEKISSLCRAEAGNGNGKKAIACQWGEFRLLIEPGDERSATEKEQIGPISRLHQNTAL